MSNQAPAILRAAALAALLVGVVLVLGSWDGLYDALDVPQSLPAIGTQVGGVALIALAYVLWAGAARSELTATAAVAGALAEGGAAVVIAAWLILRDPIDLASPSDLDGIGDLGTGLLIGTAVVLGTLALAQAWVALALRRATPPAAG
jgi:hypothetical protein